MDGLPEPAVGDDLKELWKLVLDLPAKYKTVVYLFYYEGYATREIARILEMKETTVRSQLHTARKLLKMEMEEPVYAIGRPESSH
jgi:RNA polymerase sigma-70 factor (ECF subfamily)